MGRSAERAGPQLAVDAATWRRLNPLLDAALDLPPAKREAWLQALPPEHADLRGPLRALLGAPSRVLDTAAPAALLGEVARRAGDRVGPWRLLERLGSGGMGEVWRAERADGLMQREVALKLPFAWAGGLAARLGRERNILAALVHPHIARLYDAGLAEGGQPWLALEIVAGQRIDQWADQQRLDVPARLRLALQAVRAVAHAHAQLVVHRDLKPSNLLVDAAGQVKLLDFGIAKLLDAEGDGDGQAAELTEQGARPMTPGYASPEQVAGGPVGTRSDVYSLGVLLYELLAGVSPYGAALASRTDLEAAVLHAQPRRPSEAAADPGRRKALRGDLDTIVLHALAKRPEDRYATADALADDIERHLAHRPLQARPDGRWQALKKLVRRHAVAFGAGSAIALALLAGSSVALWQGLQARAERERAEQVKAFVVGILRDASPYQGRDVAHLSAADLVLQAQERLRQAAIRSPEVRVELGVLIGEALLTSSRLDAAERQLAEAAALARRELGDAHPLTMSARVAAAQTLRLRGRIAEQHQELAEVLALARRVPAAEPDALLSVLEHGAINAIDRGALAEAEALATEAHQLAQRALPPDDADAAAAVTLRAMAHVQARHYDDARTVGEDALRRAQAAHPGAAPHPRVMEALLVYGRALAETGELEPGIARMEEALQQGEQLLPADDVSLALARQTLGVYLLETGDGDAAARPLQQALDVIAPAMTPGSVHAGRTRAALGLAWLVAGRPAEALAELDAGTEVLTRTLPPGHDLVLMPAASAALALARLGRGDEALARLQALAGPLRGAQVQESTRMRALLARAVAERGLGRPAEALATLQPLVGGTGGAMRVQRERLRGFVEAGWAQLALGRRDEARASFDVALAESLRLERVDTATRAQARLGRQAAAAPP